MMKCPRCKIKNTIVLDSRTIANGEIVARRRKCRNCGYRFKSKETYGSQNEI